MCVCVWGVGGGGKIRNAVYTCMHIVYRAGGGGGGRGAGVQATFSTFYILRSLKK